MEVVGELGWVIRRAGSSEPASHWLKSRHGAQPRGLTPGLPFPGSSPADVCGRRCLEEVPHVLYPQNHLQRSHPLAPGSLKITGHMLLLMRDC